MIYSQVQKELKKLEKTISNLEAQLQSFPKGKLFCTTNGKYHKWYHSTKGACTYIPKKDRHLAEQLALKKLFCTQFKPHSKELADWANAPYKTNRSHPEQLQYKTSSGILVRSKSEAIIELLLHTHNLPFRYECILTLENNTFFPDFTIRHPLTGETYYWEHFGLIDDPGYRKNAMQKLQIYASHGIYPTINLITTYESKASPLNPEYVELLISHYFK